MESTPGKVGRDAPKLDRCPQKRTPKRTALGVVVERAAAGNSAESECGQPLPRHGEITRQDIPQSDFTVLRNPSLEHDSKTVARLNVPGEVDLPGVHICQV